MPGTIFHLREASRLCGCCAPLIGKSPSHVLTHEERGAFVAGAVAPDFGFYCGQDLVGNLCHYQAASDLARSMLDNASTSVDRAFVCGWFSHIIADVAVHPLINSAAARLATKRSFYPERRTSLTYADSACLHIQVEFGWDVTITCSGEYELPGELLSESQAELLSATMFQLYGLGVASESLHSSARLARKRLNLVLRMSEWHHLRLFSGDSLSQHESQESEGEAEMYSADGVSQKRPAFKLNVRQRWLFRLMRLLAKLAPTSVLYGAMHPVVPDDALRESLAVARPKLEEEFRNAAAESFASLENYNLDIGCLASDEQAIEYPLKLRTDEMLKRATAR